MTCQPDPNVDVVDDVVKPQLREAPGNRTALILRGSGWSVAGYVSTQLLRTGATLVLARQFLGPEVFGLIGLVAVFLSGLGMFSELGIVQNIVQHRRGDEPLFLNTAYSIQAVRGLCIWTIALAAAYPLALFYHQPQLFPLLAVSGVSEMVRALSSTAAWTLNRHVNLRNLTLLAIFSEVAGAAVCVAWAAVSPSAWALVARTIAAAAVSAVGSHYIAGIKVRFQWDRAAARDILHFGGWISAATAAHFMGSQSERLILGKFVTPAELGCFSLALMISSVPGNGIGQLVNQIFLPVISSSARASRSRTIQDFRRARGGFFLLAVLTGAGFLFCSQLLVRLVLPPKYAITGWVLQVLGLRVGLDMFTAPTTSVVLAYGRSKYSAAANVTRLALMIIGISVSFAYFGFRPAVVSLVIAQALSYFPLIAGLNKLLPEVARREFVWYVALLVLLAGTAAVSGVSI
jgi:O-antigen/teichoic acid export membrane protein